MNGGGGGGEKREAEISANNGWRKKMAPAK